MHIGWQTYTQLNSYSWSTNTLIHTNTTCRIVVHLHARRGNRVWNKSLRRRDCPQDDQTFQIWPVKSHMHSLYLFIHPGLRWSPRSFVIRVDIGFFWAVGRSMEDATNRHIVEMVSFLKVSLGQIKGVDWFSVSMNRWRKWLDDLEPKMISQESKSMEN